MDLTWANPAASRRVSGWGMSPEETLSDHLYISMEVAIGGAMSAGPPAHRPTGKENVCTRPTAKRGGPCNKPSRKRRDGFGTSQKASLDSDPCGRPYKMVLNKLRPCNGEHGPSVPGGGCRHPVPGSGERGRC